MRVRGDATVGIMSPVKALMRGIVRRLAARRLTRSWLNAMYKPLGYAGCERFHRGFAMIFQGVDQNAQPGEWQVKFAGKTIRMPLGKPSFWLDWVNAVSITGHDVAIKQTYEDLLSSPLRPDRFIDIGANYGTHSLLFLVHGIPAISFEPNPSCHGYLQACAAANSVTARIEGVAVGDAPGVIELWYPENETWLGSTDPDVRTQLEASHQLKTQRVPIVRLDDYLKEFENKRLVIKIDVEGKEAAVVRGAIQTLKMCRPPVLFESWPNPQRVELFDLWDSLDYKIFRLPWWLNHTQTSVNRDVFLSDPTPNFIALPNTPGKADR